MLDDIISGVTELFFGDEGEGLEGKGDFPQEGGEESQEGNEGSEEGGKEPEPGYNPLPQKGYNPTFGAQSCWENEGCRKRHSTENTVYYVVH